MERVTSQERQVGREPRRANLNKKREALHHRVFLHQQAHTKRLEKEVAMKDRNYLQKLKDIEMKTLEALEEQRRGIMSEAARELSKQEIKAYDSVRNLEHSSWQKFEIDEKLIRNILLR